MMERNPLIPSLAVQGKKGKWYFGPEAAGMTPDDQTPVYQNWKANLFRPNNDEESASAIIVAQQFFTWFREKIELANVDLEKTEVRVALPAFQNVGEKALLIARCMKMAGWGCPKILKATEPHANVLGLFTSGENSLGTNKHGEVLLHFGRMFGMDSGYVERARDIVLYSRNLNASYRVMVVDIGAFTTDVASLVFNVKSEQDGLTNVDQASYEIGVINQLDKPLFAALEQRHGFSAREISFSQCEQLKSDLYHGKIHSLLTKGKGALEIGGAGDLDLVEKHTKEFTDQIWETVKKHIEVKRPDEVRLTGGGSLIAEVAKTLTKSMRSKRIRVEQTDGVESTNRGNARWRVWQATGEALGRLATAIGGASVILQAPVEPVRRHAARAIKIPEPIRDYQSCYCLGANKDCCFCDGRGYYRRI